MSIDQKINDLFKIVREQKAEVEAAEKISKQSWKTNCTIHLVNVFMPGTGQQNLPLNIQTATEEAIKMVVATLLCFKDYTARAEKILAARPGNLPRAEVVENNKFDGFSYDDWFADCGKRITVIGLRNKKDKLAEMEKRLNAIVSPEQRRAMELEAIAESLGVTAEIK